jgi:hypothetical protein
MSEYSWRQAKAESCTCQHGRKRHTRRDFFTIERRVFRRRSVPCIVVKNKWATRNISEMSIEQHFLECITPSWTCKTKQWPEKTETRRYTPETWFFMYINLRTVSFSASRNKFRSYSFQASNVGGKPSLGSEEGYKGGSRTKSRPKSLMSPDELNLAKKNRNMKEKNAKSNIRQ